MKIERIIELILWLSSFACLSVSIVYSTSSDDLYFCNQKDIDETIGLSLFGSLVLIALSVYVHNQNDEDSKPKY